MNEITSKSLAQIVRDDHRAAAIFEKYHLDFCCKGKRSLEQACAENNLEVQDVLTDLERMKQVSSDKPAGIFDHFSLGQLAEYIVMTHHEYLRKEMPAISSYLRRVASKHGDRHPEMLKVFDLFEALREELEHHMQKEELVLFPRIKAMEQQLVEGNELRINYTYLQSPIDVMEHEHDHAGGLLEEMRSLTNGYNPPADACTTYRLSLASLQALEIDLHQHVHLENNILFPKALKMFGIPHTSSLN